jgi:hypothetical protein
MYRYGFISVLAYIDQKFAIMQLTQIRIPDEYQLPCGSS